jgi:hypothetical protein
MREGPAVLIRPGGDSDPGLSSCSAASQCGTTVLCRQPRRQCADQRSVSLARDTRRRADSDAKRRLLDAPGLPQATANAESRLQSQCRQLQLQQACCTGKSDSPHPLTLLSGSPAARRPGSHGRWASATRLGTALDSDLSTLPRPGPSRSCRDHRRAAFKGDSTRHAGRGGLASDRAALTRPTHPALLSPRLPDGFGDRRVRPGPGSTVTVTA